MHELVLFGGDTMARGTGEVFRGTWTRSGRTWTKRNPTHSPSARTGAAMVYDAATGQLLLFGGYSKPFLDDARARQTWVWTGSDWRLLHPAVSPSGRRDADMVYDAATKNVILFGGCCGYFGDTWAWNGRTWTQLHPATSPPGRDGASLVYDGATGTAILFGGFAPAVSGGQENFNDTWSWDGTTWTQLHPAAHPHAGGTAWMAAYDPASRQLLLLDTGWGRSGLGSNSYWIWTGTTWKEIWPHSAPGARGDASMTYDSAARKIVLFGGSAPGGIYPTATWFWNGKTWRSG